MAEYRAPTSEQVREALRRIPTPQLRRAFFEGLKNPLWVAPLAAEGAFAYPPEPVQTDDGLVQDIYWSEIDYLARVATEVPNDVVDVLLRLSDSNNAWVRRGAFEIGAAIPPEEAARLRPLIEAWLPNGLGWRTDPRDLVSFAVNLLSGHEAKAGRWFANVIFRPSSTDKQAPRNVLKDYWYEKELPRVVEALGADGLQVILPWLVEYETQAGRFSQQSDLSYFLRDSIRNRGDNHADVKHALVDAVRDLAVRAMLTDSRGATALLVNTGMLLARKIAMYAVAEALNNADDDEMRGELLAVANRLLFEDEASADASCRIDFAGLARAVSDATGEPLAQLTGFIGPGPRIDADRLRNRVAEDGANDSEVDEQVANFVRRWKHRWLSAIGLEALPQPLRDELSRLDEEFGAIEDPLEPGDRITSWVGPTSPLDQDEMSMMSPAELVGHLESWHASESRWGPAPSHEGQGRELTALLGTNPNALGDITGLVERLRPTYVRAVLSGWEAALKATLGIDWAQVVRLLTDVLSHSDESAHQPEGDDFDDDPDMRLCKQAAVGLIEEAVKQQDAFTVPDEVMDQLADLLVSAADDERAWDEYLGHDGTSGMDALTTSLNWQWPVRLRGLTHLMAWGSEKTWFEPARLALERDLERDDPWGASRAVLGEAIGRLIDATPDWVASKVAEIFGTGSRLSVGQQIAFTTAMAAYRYHHSLYELLSPAMIAAIDSGEEIVAGWDHAQSNPIQRIGEWVIQAIMRGDSTIEEPVAAAFFSTAPADVRGAALGHIGWSFMHAAEVDHSIRERLESLWDDRVAFVRAHAGSEAELSGFYWFVRSHKFPIEWWLPRLHEALELYPALGAERYMIGKEIAAAADVDPRMTFDVLRLLLAVRDVGGLASYDLTRNAVPMVLGRAVASGDDELMADAVSFMNQLGEAGNLTLEAEVTAVVDGIITQADVDE